MNKDFLIDYSSYIGFKALYFIIRVLPKGFSLFLGRRAGDLLYYLNLKLKAKVYANIKTALTETQGPGELSKITRNFFRNFGQNLTEIFFIPSINEDYIIKYISVSGLEHIYAAFKNGKGIILLSVHAGSWELSNIIASNLGFPFKVLVRPQGKFRRVGKLLNSYRTQDNSQIVQRSNQTRLLIESIKNNQAIGMTFDQGGKAGTAVKFFNKEASMASGAVKLALKYGVPILPCFYNRLKGPYIKVTIDKPFAVKETGDIKKDIQDNLQRLTFEFEKYIKKYPQEYLWSYKVWKYGHDRRILILSDGKTGHLRQSQAVANIISQRFTQEGLRTEVETAGIKLKNQKLAKFALLFCAKLAGKYRCQGCLSCLKRLLDEQAYNRLIRSSPDIVISCGALTYPVNFLIARENLAKSVVVMKPSLLSARHFDLVVMARHDNHRLRKNIVVTEAALNLINDEYLKDQSQRLLSYMPNKVTGSCIGLFIGGDSKGFKLKIELIQEVIRQIKAVSEKIKADILVTTSRRTPPELENLLKQELQNYPLCKLLIIANEKNIPEAVGGILGLSDIVVVSAESISMISEAISSKKYVLVFKSDNLSAKHRNFLDYLVRNNYIYLTEGGALAEEIKEIFIAKPKIPQLKDNLTVSEAIKKIL